MSGENTTLVSEVVWVRPTGVERLHDVPVVVQHSLRGHTLITMQGHERAVTVRLSPAERISLIEALGGTVA
jgi:hypothetical protein